MDTTKKHLQGMNRQELAQAFADARLPKFRVQQVLEWLYGKGETSYNNMTNLPKQLRSDLAVAVPSKPASIVEVREDADKTRKYVLQYPDGVLVEAVGMPSAELNEDGTPKHLSVCISTQAGCPMACAFCATGHAGFERNLAPGEIVEQVLAVQKDFNTRVSHVVTMGQGEPFLNFDAVIEALSLLNDEKLLNIGARHITLSTCGIINGINKLANTPEQYTLAVSLHSAFQDKRNELLPRCANQPLPQLKKALIAYTERTGRRPSLEYAMIDGVNTDEEDLAALLEFVDGLHCHVNLIPLNKVDSSPWQPAPASVMKHWKQELTRHGTETTIRNSRGANIDAACGQLKSKYLAAQATN